MKKRFVTFVLVVCMMCTITVPAFAAEAEYDKMENDIVPVDDIAIDVAALVDADINKASVGNDVYEFEAAQQVEVNEKDGKEVVVCTSTKILAVGAEEAQKVEKNIQKLQSRRGTTGGTVSGSYLGGSATLQCTTSIWTTVISGVTYYRILNMSTKASVSSGVTYHNVRVDFFQKGYNTAGKVVDQKAPGYFSVRYPTLATAPETWGEIRETYDADIGGKYVCELTKSGKTTTVTLNNYYF